MRIRNTSAKGGLACSLIAVLALSASLAVYSGGCSGNKIPLGGLIPSSINAGGTSLDTGKLVEGGQKLINTATLDQRHEKAIGESVSVALTNKYGVVEDDDLNRYVMFVGQTVAYRTPMGDQPWIFGVLATDDVNAFSAPGGYVFVTRGAIQRMRDESELAGVLAHEIGHVNRHHALDAIQKAGLLDALATAAQANQQVAQFDQASDLVVKFITENGFQAPQEFEADESAVKYVAAAGYDPNGLLHFLQRIRDQQKQGFKLMSTHPDTDDRVQRISNQISSSGTGGHGATLKERFEKSVKGRQSAARVD